MLWKTFSGVWVALKITIFPIHNIQQIISYYLLQIKSPRQISHNNTNQLISHDKKKKKPIIGFCNHKKIGGYSSNMRGKKKKKLAALLGGVQQINILKALERQWCGFLGCGLLDWGLLGQDLAECGTEICGSNREEKGWVGGCCVCICESYFPGQT